VPGITSLQKRELHKLLDRYEGRKDYGTGKNSRRRTMLRIDGRSYPEYFSVSDSSFRRRFNLEMEDLERRGWVELEWERFEHGETLKRVVLNTCCLDEIYRRLGREPKKSRYARLERLAGEWREKSPGILHGFYGDLVERFSSYKALPAALSSFDFRDFEQFFRLLDAVCSLKHEMPKRRFSARIFGDSKRWDDFEKAVLWVLRNYCSREEEPELDDKEILSEWGLLDNPQHINISGPLKFRTPRGEVDVLLHYPDLGLSPRMAADMEILDLEADAVVTVENLSSFYHYVDEGPENHLVIYLGGYHNRSRREVLRRIYKYSAQNGKNIPFYHWGDIDLGGFRIWHHLRRGTGIDVIPLMMDEETYLAYEKWGQPFKKSYGKKLCQLLERVEYEPFHGVIEIMLQKGKRLEQEAVREIKFVS